MERLGTPVTFQYAFTDLNKDGVDELLVSNQYTGNKQYVSAYLLPQGSKAELLHTAYTAAVGGYRSSLDVFDNGQIVYATWQSINPEMELTLYSPGKGEAKEEKKATIQIGGRKQQNKLLGFQPRSWILESSTGKTFEGSGDSNQHQSGETKTGSFQVQVSVADLRIRKEPSTSAPSAGMIAKGTHTITETVEADGHTWGKWNLDKVGSPLNSQRAWMVLNQQAQVKSSGMNIQTPERKFLRYRRNLENGKKG